MTFYLVSAFLYLAAAVIMVPLAKRFGLGSVLGYLMAGIIIGPALGLVGQETNTIQHFAEFGVVMMLFLVGLELEPKSLWKMRHKLLGLGGLQVLLTMIAIAGLALAFGLAWQTSLAIGMIFSLSSTAIVLQTLSEKHLTNTEGGRNAFSVLLVQDIAVIPMLALLPLLALAQFAPETSTVASDGHHTQTLLEMLPPWASALAVLASIIVVVVIGHFLARPLFKMVAEAKLRELFVASALLLVIGIAALMSLVGVSPALGTFLAGVMLANSEFKHELESNIEPFKGLLLGLFFITVGAGINFVVLFENALLVTGLVLAVMIIKGVILLGIAMAFKLKNVGGWLFVLSLAQAGEFGFVLINFSVSQSVLPPDIVQILLLVVAITMFLTPLLFIAYDRIIVPRYQSKSEEAQSDNIEERGKVIIAGIGRYGQIVNRMLTASGVSTVVLDARASQVETVRSVDIKSYFGDATRPEMLHTAGIEEAQMIVIAVDDHHGAVELTHHVKQFHPHVYILARAFDRGHGYQLRAAGADSVVSETFYSALETGSSALKQLGFHPFRVEQKMHAYEHVEEAASDELYEAWKTGSEGERYSSDFRQLFLKLEQAFKTALQRERHEKHLSEDRGWAPPPKRYTDELKDNDQSH